MTESERLDYFLNHRVSSVVDNDDMNFRASYEEQNEGGGGGDGMNYDEESPPPPYVQSQLEAVQERRMRMQGRGA
jgi:hypothetical protein